MCRVTFESQKICDDTFNLTKLLSQSKYIYRIRVQRFMAVACQRDGAVSIINDRLLSRRNNTGPLHHLVAPIESFSDALFVYTVYVFNLNAEIRSTTVVRKGLFDGLDCGC
jgi:hypothetical protein